MAYRVQFRRDTANRWSSINPILQEGEFGYETDTRKGKVGDGVHTWNELEYTDSISQIKDNFIIGHLNISDIDFDRSKCAELINLNATTYYNVYTMFGPDKASVGTMICFSDNITHVLTQVLFSHFPDPNSGLSHKDAEIYVHYRSFNYKRSTLDIPAYTWSAWKLLTSSEFNSRFVGEASDSSADTDPFIVLGRFSKGESETTQAFYDRVNTTIDSTFSQDAGSENNKYCGDMRVFTNGVRTNIHQYVINFGAGKYVQVADGPIDVDENGKLLFSRDNYKVFSRLIEGGVAGSWTEFGGSSNAGLMGSGDITKINNANTLSEAYAYYGVNRFNGFTDGVTLQMNTSLKRLPVMYDRTLKTFVGKDIDIQGGTGTIKYYSTWLGSNIFNDISTKKPHAEHTYLCAGKMYEWDGTDLVEISSF